MTGPHDSVIGVEAELAIRRMRTGLPVRFETAQGGVRIEGAVVECDADGASSIEASAFPSPDQRSGRSSQEDEGHDPREVEVEPVGQRELERGEHAAVSAASWSGLLRLGTTATSAASATASATTTGCRKPRSGIPRAWYWPQPQIEKGESRPDWNPIVRSQNVRAASHSDGSSRRIENASAVATTNAAAKRSTRRSSNTGYVAHSGATSSAPNFVQPRARPTRRAPSPT